MIDMKHVRPKKFQQGIAILISILFIGILLSIVFALTAVFIPKIRSTAEIKNSVGAAYAAESALEWCLYQYDYPALPLPSPTMDYGSSYIVSNCAPPSVRAIGTYRGVTRAFEISF